MGDGKLRLVLVTAAIGLILIALVAVGSFNVMLFKKSYEDSISRSYQVAVFPTKRNIEYALRYGKSLTRFYGMEKLLQKIKTDIPEVEEIYVVQADSQILYDLSGAVEGKSLPLELTRRISNISASTDGNVVVDIFNAKYHYFIPIKDKDNNSVGYINLLLPQSIINSYVEENIWKVLQATVVVGITSLNFLVFLLFAIPIFTSEGIVRKNRLISLVVAIFLLANCCYTVFSAGLFDRSYGTLTEKNMGILLQSTGDDINSVLAKGVSYRELTGVEDHLSKIMVGLPEIGNIVITDNAEQQLYYTATTDNLTRETGISINRDMLTDNTGATGKISISLEPTYLHSMIKNIILRSMSISVIFLLLIFIVMYKVVDFIPLIKAKLLTKENYSRKSQFTSEVK
ncbi:MAG: hypothetical protein H6Q68_1843 [Firmicutes bacterium]|nr:hypothetical protein [Bacillota bacterium]